MLADAPASWGQTDQEVSCQACPGTSSQGLEGSIRALGTSLLAPQGVEGCCSLFSLCLLIAWKQS